MATKHLVGLLTYQCSINETMRERGMVSEGSSVLTPAEFAALEPSYNDGLPVSDFVEWVIEQRRRERVA